MNKDLIYIQNYYNLKRNIEENNFIESLNEEDISSSIQSVLKTVSDKLYIQITSGENPENSYEGWIKNAEKINKRLNEILSKSEFYNNINDEKITSNFFTNAFIKLCRRVFIKDGHNDEKYLLQSYVLYWLEDNLANTIIKDDRYKPYDIISKLLNQTEILHHFYNSFKNKIPVSWIDDQKEKWIEVIKNQKNILDGMRIFDTDYFKGYELQLKEYKNYSSWRYTDEATRYSDHAMLNDEYSFKTLVLFEKNISLWIKFWDNLKWPILQDMPFHYIQKPNNILLIAKELVNLKDKLVSDTKQLTFILLKNLFDSSLEVQENLAFYNDDTRITSLSDYEKNETIISKGKELFILWQDEKEGIYKQTIQTLLTLVSVEEMSEWVFSYKPRTSARGNYDTSYNKEIEILVNAFNPNIISEPFETQIQNVTTNFNLQKFNFLSSQINNETEKTHIESLLTTLTKYIRSEFFYWDGTFSPAYWPTLKGIGSLLSLTPNPTLKAKDIIQCFKVQHEGWNITPIDYKFTQQESFVLCGAILLLEHDKAFRDIEERTSYFNYILKLIISQTRFSHINKDNDYKLPIYLLHLVVNQIYTELKDVFEETVINDIDDIKTVIEILSNDDYKLLLPSVNLLKNRIDIELNFERRKFMQKGLAVEIEKIEKSIKKLGISFP